MTRRSGKEGRTDHPFTQLAKTTTQGKPNRRIDAEDRRQVGWLGKILDDAAERQVDWKAIDTVLEPLTKQHNYFSAEIDKWKALTLKLYRLLSEPMPEAYREKVLDEFAALARRKGTKMVKHEDVECPNCGCKIHLCGTEMDESIRQAEAKGREAMREEAAQVPRLNPRSAAGHKKRWEPKPPPLKP